MKAMPVIRFVKNYPDLEVPEGAVLMEALLKAGFPVASSCHGDGICAKCRIQVINGAENLSQPTVLEEILRDRLRIAKDLRISCQAKVMGDITIDASYW